MGLTKKLGLFFAGLFFALILVAAMGVNGQRSLSQILNYICGPAWDTADGAMEATIGIKGEMNWILNRLLGNVQEFNG